MTGEPDNTGRPFLIRNTTMQTDPRFLALDNIARAEGPMIAKGTTVHLSELRDSGCDLRHLLRAGALREFVGDGRRASALLLRKDSPSPEEYIAEITRMQAALEQLEAANDDLRRNRPTPTPSALPPDLHVMAERIHELEEQNASLTASLKTAPPSILRVGSPCTVPPHTWPGTLRMPA